MIVEVHNAFYLFMLLHKQVKCIMYPIDIRGEMWNQGYMIRLTPRW